MAETKNSLIEEISNLFELKMNELLRNCAEIRILKNPDIISQQYFYLKDDDYISLSEELMLKVLGKFSDNFSDFGLGCVVSSHYIQLGISHLSTAKLKNVLNNLRTKK
jgi:hypothetical protein